MALQTESLKRVFNYKGEELQDPNLGLTPAEVLDFYSDKYPELVNATMSGPNISEHKAEFTFEVKFKEKG